jgi:hypothetical protein
MSVEATFYTLSHPLPDSILASMKRSPGVEHLEAIRQQELHEHLVGFVGFVMTVTEGSDDPRTIALVRYILSVGAAIDFKFEASQVGDSAQMRIREQLAAFGGIWLIADGVFDVDGRMILGNDGSRDEKALIPEVPEARLTSAEFLYDVIERERDLEDQGEAPSTTRLTERPLDECYRMIAFGRSRAAEYGLVSAEDQLSFVSVMLEIGPNFDDHHMIRKILQDESITPSERLNACIDHENAEQIWEEVEALIDHDRWTSATSH